MQYLRMSYEKSVASVHPYNFQHVPLIQMIPGNETRVMKMMNRIAEMGPNIVMGRARICTLLATPIAVSW